MIIKNPVQQPSKQVLMDINREQLQENLAKYEQLRIKNESQGLTSMVKNAITRMAYDCKCNINWRRYFLFFRQTKMSLYNNIPSLYLYLTYIFLLLFRHAHFDKTARFKRVTDPFASENERDRNLAPNEWDSSVLLARTQYVSRLHMELEACSCCR